MKNSIRCPCGGSAPYRKDLRFNNNPIEGWKCEKCKESYYNPIQAERILLINKIRKMKYLVKVGKMKSNYIIRIPKEVGEALDLKQGKEVELGIRGEKEIVISAL
ncbi:MAG: AbrB/MazE/SpoVT family DNA-binding domain-containing protein [Nanoarchaeota archaeon]